MNRINRMGRIFNIQHGIFNDEGKRSHVSDDIAKWPLAAGRDMEEGGMWDVSW